MYKKIENSLYRVKTEKGDFVFVEADSMDSLIEFCAQYTVKGHIISGVNLLPPFGTGTPRVKVLSTPAFKKAVEKERNRVAAINRNETSCDMGQDPNSSIKVGDTVRTPRFMTVTIKETFEDEDAMMQAGYTEPTYYEGQDGYAVRGKSIDMYHMVFAAAPKVKATEPLKQYSAEDLVHIYEELFDMNLEAADEDYAEEYEAQYGPDAVFSSTPTKRDVIFALISLVKELIDDTGDEVCVKNWVAECSDDEFYDALMQAAKA